MKHVECSKYWQYICYQRPVATTLTTSCHGIPQQGLALVSSSYHLACLRPHSPTTFTLLLTSGANAMPITWFTSCLWPLSTPMLNLFRNFDLINQNKRSLLQPQLWQYHQSNVLSHCSLLPSTYFYSNDDSQPHCAGSKQRKHHKRMQQTANKNLLHPYTMLLSL